MMNVYHRLFGTSTKSSVIYDDENPDVFPLVWLDSLVNTSEENLDGQRLIRASIDHLKTFENSDQCEDYLRSLSENERIIFIVSGRLGREMIPRIHQFRQVSSIYVYCLDKSSNESWAKQYKKIKDIVTEFQELINKIRFERSKRSQNEVNDPFLISVYQTNSPSTQFIYSQLLINVLLQTTPITTDKDKLLSLCKENYHEIDYELKHIQEFEEHYSFNQALNWYMRDSFIYRLLNRVLQLQDIDLLFLFRFFIHDIRRGIEQHQCTSSLHVYRSQLMSNKEIDLLKESLGNLISINSFLSTSMHRQLALLFLNQSSSSSDDLEQVMFEITANPLHTPCKPFGFMKSKHYFRPPEEVLFTLGSIFRLNQLYQQSNGMWIVQLTLCSDDDQQAREIFKPFKNNVLSFGHFLSKIGRTNEAEKFFARLLDELSKNTEDLAECYYALGCIGMEKKMYDLSLGWHEKALEIKLKLLKETDLSIADSYTRLGQIYLQKCDYKQALSAYLQALNIIMQVKGEDHLDVARIYTNIGGIYQKQGNYTSALECHEKALDIRQKQLSTDHPDLGISHNNIAIMYSCLDRYNLALEHYNLALKILQNKLPSSHPEIAVSFCGLGLICEQKEELEQAYSYYQKAAIIYRQTYSPTHPDVIQIEQHIQRISSKF